MKDKLCDQQKDRSIFCSLTHLHSVLKKKINKYKTLRYIIAYDLVNKLENSDYNRICYSL